jgi:two-component system chemotaxis response regulator CheB
MHEGCATDLCPGSAFGLIVLAGSAGALTSYRRILARIDRDFPTAIVVAHHMATVCQISLPALLQPFTSAHVQWAQPGTRAQAAVVYVVPPGQSLTLAENGTFELNAAGIPFTSANLLLYSAARRLGARGLAVVVSGAGIDGSAGAAALHAAGGTVVIESGATATFFGMGRAAVELHAADLLLPIDEIGPTLVRLASPNQLSIRNH